MKGEGERVRTPALLTLCVVSAAHGACGGSGSHHRKPHDTGKLADAGSDAGEDAGQDAGHPPSPEQALEDHQSGTRLRARVLVSDEGATQWLGWHDSMRDEACTFVTTTDGKLRCLPWGGNAARPQFSDTKCTHPVSVRPKTQEDCTPPSPKYAMEVEVVDCISRHTLRPLGKIVSGATTVYSKNGDACIGRKLLNEQLFALGAAVAPASFVGAETSVEDQGERLGALVQKADDGSIERIGWYDSQLKMACELGIMSGDASVRCVPTNYVIDGNAWFSDAMCMTRVAIGFAVECANGTPVIRRFEDKGCDVRTSVFALADELDQSAVFTGPESCRPASETLPGESGAHFYALGTEYAPSALASLKLVRAGKGRLTASYEQSAGGKRRMVRGNFYDTMLKTACTFARASDGMQRCVASSLFDTQAFSDTACKHPIAGASVSADCKPSSTYVTINQASNLDCNGATRTYHGGAAIGAPKNLYFKQYDGTCTAGGSSATSFVRVGSEIAAQGLVSASEKLE
jgi:hypothetical protein